jgi:hypothetical protein
MQSMNQMDISILQNDMPVSTRCGYVLYQCNADPTLCKCLDPTLPIDMHSIKSLFEDSSNGFPPWPTPPEKE